MCTRVENVDGLCSSECNMRMHNICNYLSSEFEIARAQMQFCCFSTVVQLIRTWRILFESMAKQLFKLIRFVYEKKKKLRTFHVLNG